MLPIQPNHFSGGACLTGPGAGGKASLQELLEELQNPPSATIGDGTTSVSLTLNKDDVSAGDINLKSDDVLRGRIRLTSAETLVIEVFNASGITQGSVTVAADGSVTLTDGLTVMSGNVAFPLPEYADNAAALAGGLTANMLYHTAGAVKLVT